MKWLMQHISDVVTRMVARMATYVLEKHIGYLEASILETSPLALAYAAKWYMVAEYPLSDNGCRYVVYIRNGFPCLMIHNTLTKKSYLVRVFA